MNNRVLTAFAIAGCLLPPALAQLTATNVASHVKAQPQADSFASGSGGSAILLAAGTDTLPAPGAISNSGPLPEPWLPDITIQSGFGSRFCVLHTAGVIPCPCSSGAAVGHGCNNSENTGGALLSVAGTASLTDDRVLFICSGELPTALSVILQGDALIASTKFGQGVLCTGGRLIRLYTKNAVGGVIVAPEAGDRRAHAQSAALGDTLFAGATRYHQVYYRDLIVHVPCDPSADTFNTSQGQAITWSP